MTESNKTTRNPNPIYNITVFYLPLPDIMIMKSKYRSPIESLSLGHPKKYSDWCNEITGEGKAQKVQFSQFIRNLGNWRFNLQYVPLKYRKQLKEYYYIHKSAIHSLFPLYATTSQNSFLYSIQKKGLELVNPTITAKAYSIGVIQFSLAFFTWEIPSAIELQNLNNKFKKYLKSIKLSLIQSFYKSEEVDSVYGSITPSDGFTFHVYIKNDNKLLPRIAAEWKSLGKLKTTSTKIFMRHNKRFVIEMERKSKTLRKDVLLPLLWGTCLKSIMDTHTAFILRHLQNEKLDTNDFESLWIATASTLNPIIHYITFPGKSPYLCKLYQKEIFQKYCFSQQLEQKYNTFISSLKKQSLYFNPLAHKVLRNFEQDEVLDPRIGLHSEIQSNMKRISYPTFEDLTETEYRIINVLLKKYNHDLERAEAGSIIGTQSMGWMPLLHLGQELGLSEHEIYSTIKKSDFDLKRTLLFIAKKGLIETRDLSRGRILESRVNIQHNQIKLHIGKFVIQHSESRKK